ncbi:copper resistance CopC family protein [Nonomuraea polychroma]|uniref:copper resistance CopC family protein n=1 Tax=Nonomuraea polychroma TaxID=46176 RepID=UPI003D933E2B
MVLLLACVAVGLLPPAAQAHNVLIGSDPKDGATLSASPARVTLLFDQAVRRGYAQVGVTGADGSAWADGDAVVAAERVSVKVKPLPAGGSYVVGYRILSADGHPVTGKIAFRLTADASGVAAGQPAPSSAVTAPGTTAGEIAESSGADTSGAGTGEIAGDSSAEATEAAANGGAGMAVVWIVGALLVLAAGTAVALRRAPATRTAPTGLTATAPGGEADAPGGSRDEAAGAASTRGATAGDVQAPRRRS